VHESKKDALTRRCARDQVFYSGGISTKTCRTSSAKSISCASHGLMAGENAVIGGHRPPRDLRIAQRCWSRSRRLRR
jgi:hypothetical protein